MTTTTGRKVRADAKLEQLNEAQHERLRGWLEEKSYAAVASLVGQEFGISVGKSTVAAYWQRHVLPERQQDDAEIVAVLTALPAGDFDAATLQQVRALALSALARPFPNIDEAVKLLAVVRKAEQQALAVQRQAEQHEIALKRLALEERRLALREKLAGQPREQFKSSRSDGRERVEGLQRDTQVYPPSTRSRLSLPEAAAPAERQSEAPCELQTPPRFPGYSGLVRPQDEVGESVETVERGERAEVATKAQRGEGLSKGPEDANFSASGGDGRERRTANIELRTSKDGEGGVCGDGLREPVPLAPSPAATIPLAATTPPSTCSRSSLPEAGSGAGDAPPTQAQGNGGEAEIAQAIARREILRGMTPQQVVRTWGEPQLKGAALKDFNRFDHWLYRSETDEKQVYFDHGEVSTWAVRARGKKAKEPASPCRSDSASVVSRK